MLSRRSGNRRFAQVQPLEPRQLLAGVTLLAHGYAGSINGWVATAANAIVARAGGGGAASEYILRVTNTGSRGLAVTSFELESGSQPFTNTSAAEMVVKLDWSTVSDGSFSTGAVARVVADYVSTSQGGALPRLAEYPLHLIGYSRGASLVTALSAYLGEAGIWVDHQTNLDPHPVDAREDILDADFGDRSMATHENVAFADTYWRTDGQTMNFDFDGEPVDGTYNGDLNNTVQQQYVGGAHPSVPAYYVGTIDLAATQGGDAPIFASWYGTATTPPRDETGFYYGRLIGGARPTEGLWAASGGAGQRDATGEDGPQWANVTDVRVLGGRSFESGQTIKLRYVRQDRDGNSNVRFLLDRDQNPVNDNFVRTLRSTNLSAVDVPTANRSDGSTNGADAGTYWVCARITDAGGHVRYAYSKSFKLTSGEGSGSRQTSSYGGAATATTPLGVWASAFGSKPISEDGQLAELV